MEYRDGYFKSASDYRLYYQSWHPQDKDQIKAIIQVAHGFTGHGGRYMNVVNRLAGAGYVMYASDHRDHGKSENRGVRVEYFEQHVADQFQFNQLIREKEGDGLSVFLLGHSLGATIAIHFAAKHGKRLAGLVLSGAGTKINAVSPVTGLLLKIVAKIAPGTAVTATLTPEELSHDDAAVQAYKDDLLVCNRTTVKSAVEMLGAFKKNSEMAGNITAPVLFQKGTADPVVAGEQAIYNNLNSSDKTLKKYPGCLHEVYNESPEMRKTVLDDLETWLDDHAR
ncbi:MAG: alpha/beta hydrolase [Candidatus Odinarchaeota archaeon]